MCPLEGIITAISKMCIKGNKGINLKKPKYLINEIVVLLW
jgi:phosphoribosylformylglycinamidine synthase